MHPRSHPKNFTGANSLPDQPKALENLIAAREQKAGPLKAGTEAKILWNDAGIKNKTACSIVYLHGFKGSCGDGDPVHKKVAAYFGCNLYLARLYGHGLKKKEPFDDLTPQKLIQSAEYACSVGQKIGNRVLLMATSAGAALALYLAGALKYAPHIAGLTLYSPLIHVYGYESLLVENRLGRSLLRYFKGADYKIETDDVFTKSEEEIWYQSYQLNGALALGHMLQKHINPSLFGQIQCPVFAGYFYKNRHYHDRVISTPAVKRMIPTLGTSPSRVQLTNFKEAGTHVICSGLLSKTVEAVMGETIKFIENHIAAKSGP